MELQKIFRDDFTFKNDFFFRIRPSSVKGLNIILRIKKSNMIKVLRRAIKKKKIIEFLLRCIYFSFFLQNKVTIEEQSLEANCRTGKKLKNQLTEII